MACPECESHKVRPDATGNKLVCEFGHSWPIEQIFEKQARALMQPETLREIAEDYLHLAQDADGKVDSLRKKRYAQLIKLAGELLKRKIEGK